MACALIAAISGPIPMMTTRQYARLLSEWLSLIGLDPALFGTHSLVGFWHFRA